ncbi:tyrosine-type recombinase/integrase [Trichocoleus sp. FACHB-262]|uniref:tyrosine-type recombinase/integrase n=1 Tax=Trichocoleus sp. FACHB-262 TaxID=2692869 RepID=UPI00168A3A4A|nr:tyrosine-type recombinase/integrase [Trichocoleus sp. FACHB-262]MBD2119335.1 tyrosine-type recombinase/integrase [Trichocoleus sp. FACHB-262]
MRQNRLVRVRSHSCRRTVLTRMSSAGVPLRVIQEISGHLSLQALQWYLGVSELQLEGRSQLLIFEGLTVAIEVFV